MMRDDSKPTDLIAAAVSALDAERIYCRGCGYSLHGLAQCRCPECGRAFSFSDAATTTKERGREDRLRFAASSRTAFIVFLVVPIVLLPFTHVFYFDLTTVIGLVMATKLREKPSMAGKGLACLFGFYLVMASWIFIALVPLGMSASLAESLFFPVWYPLLVIVWSLRNLTLWNRWEKAKRGMSVPV